MIRNLLLSTAFSFFAAISVHADDRGELIFEDDFERSESQELSDEPGKGWATNSKSRAQGEKQVDLKDGAMYIYLSEKADHGVSVTQPAEFTDGAVSMRFMLEDEKDSLGLNFADLKFKEVHAGHLFAARISTKQVLLEDLKTGKMGNEFYDARKTSGGLSDKQKEVLKTKDTKIAHKLETGKWYDLLVEIEGNKLTASIDGKEVGSFESEGIAHPSKRTLRLAVPKNAVVDDVKIYRR